MTQQILSAALKQAEQRYQRMVILADNFFLNAHPFIDEQIKKENWSYINVSFNLSEALLSLPIKQRAHDVQKIFDDMIRQQDSDIVMLDRIELMFDASLQLDPLKIISSNSRNKTIIVHWPGQNTDDNLSYATPGHTEYKVYRKKELDTIIIDE